MHWRGVALVAALALGALLLYVSERGPAPGSGRAAGRPGTTANDDAVGPSSKAPSNAPRGAIPVPVFARVAADGSAILPATPGPTPPQGWLSQREGAREGDVDEAEPQAALPPFDSAIWTEQLFQALDNASAEASLEQWSKLHPGVCSAFHGDEFARGLEEKPCADCSAAAGPWQVTYSFFPDLDRGACTLQGIQVTSPAFPKEPSPAEGQLDGGPGRRPDSWTLFEAARDAVVVALGPHRTWRDAPEVHSPPLSPHEVWLQSLGPGERGSGGWARYYRWTPRGGVAYLYYGRDLTTSDGRPEIGFLLRRASVQQLKRASDRLGGLHGRLTPAPDWSVVVHQACSEAGGADCGAAATVFREHERSDGEGIRRALDEALAVHERLLPNDPRYPAAAFFVGMLAERWGSTIATCPPDDAADVARQTALEKARVQLFADHWGIRVSLDLLVRLGLERPSSVWGQWALLKMTYRGWDLCDCGAGTRGDQFRDVIEHDEPVAAAHPQSPAVPYLEFALAQAYETWWSLSKESRAEGDAPVESSPFFSGAEDARKRALELYRTWMVAHGSVLNDDQRLWLRHKLFRLEHDIDTAEHRYYCECC